MVNKENLIYKTNKYIYNFQKFETKSFTKNIQNDKITLHNAEKDQCDLLLEIGDFNEHRKPKNISKKKQKRNTINSLSTA